MNVLSKIFSSGATELIKGVGGVIDNLHTSKEEKLEAEQKVKELVSSYEIEMEKNITERWKMDMQSDSWLSKKYTSVSISIFSSSYSIIDIYRCWSYFFYSTRQVDRSITISINNRDRCLFWR